MANEKWKPDDSFHDMENNEFKGVLRVQKVLKELGVEEFHKSIVTSRDKSMEKALNLLERKDMPQGFKKWQIPFAPKSTKPSFLFITQCQPNAEVPKHAHRNDSIIRIVMSGSIFFQGKEYTMGDWIYIPRNHPYSYKAGPYGATLMHEYPGQDD